MQSTQPAAVTMALIGCGLVSRSHLPAFRTAERVRLAAVVDLDAPRAEATATAAGQVAWTTRLEEVLEDPAIEAVAVCLPHHLHAATAERALQHGKHVFVEKPMALQLADCARMITTAEANGRVLAVGQVLRFRHAVRQARQAIEAEEIGRPVQTIRRRYSRRDQTTGQLGWSLDAATSGGLLYGNGSHEVDTVLWTLDDRPVEVYARAGALDADDRRGPTELSLLITLAGGGFSTVSLSRGTSQAVWDQWTTGTAGSLTMSGPSLTVNGEQRPLPEQPEGGFREEWEAFGAAVQEAGAGSPASACVISARTVWPTMVALECARESIRTGRPVRADAVDSWALYERT
jgi:predicted dehydrogenase